MQTQKANIAVSEHGKSRVASMSKTILTYLEFPQKLAITLVNAFKLK